MNPITAQIPTEFLELYRQLVQQAPSEGAAHAHLANFLQDAKTILTALQTVYDAAQGRQPAQ